MSQLNKWNALKLTAESKECEGAKDEISNRKLFLIFFLAIETRR